MASIGVNLLAFVSFFFCVMVLLLPCVFIGLFVMVSIFSIAKILLCRELYQLQTRINDLIDAINMDNQETYDQLQDQEFLQY